MPWKGGFLGCFHRWNGLRSAPCGQSASVPAPPFFTDSAGRDHAIELALEFSRRERDVQRPQVVVQFA